MNRNAIFFSFLVFCILAVSFFNLGFSPQPGLWQKKDQGLLSVKTYVLKTDKNGDLYAGAENGIFLRKKGEAEFAHILTLSKEQGDVRDVFIDESGLVFAACRTGLFYYNNGQWKKIFSGTGRAESQVLSVSALGERIFFGTYQGLFSGTKKEGRFVRISGEWKQKPVFRVLEQSGSLFVVTDTSVYLKTAGGSRRIFTLFSGTEEAENGNDASYAEKIKDIDIEGPWIFLATVSGIYYSSDQGKQWSRLKDASLPEEQITSLTAIKNPSLISADDDVAQWTIFISTLKGVYLYHQARWRAVYAGMDTNRAYGVAFNGMSVFCATDQGIYEIALQDALSGMSSPAADFQTMQKVLQSDPPIRKVHQLAISYAEVNPEKISDWRKRARKRAWLPDLDIGIDGDRNRTISDSVYGSYSSGGQHYIAPDDKTFYDNFGWGISLSWDLGDVVWNSDQTSIDSRSKMMVELRQDVLDQVTRVYFERRRVVLELAGLSREDPVYVEKYLRAEELTAVLDGYTGGGFSQLLKK